MEPPQHPLLSVTTVQVLQVFLADPDMAWCGTDLTRRTGVVSGTVYPMLGRLQSAGWLWSWEDDRNPRGARRRYYKLVAGKVDHVRARVDETLRRINDKVGVGPGGPGGR